MNKKLILVAVLSTMILIPTAQADASVLKWLGIDGNFNANKKVEAQVEETETEVLATMVETPVTKGVPTTVVRSNVRSVSAYNVGIVWQNDDTPCTGAYHKVDLCEEVANGKKVCAANDVPLHTYMRIHAKDGSTFDCIVWDRMNSRYGSGNIDIAMNADEIAEARQFGRQNLVVEVLNTN